MMNYPHTHGHMLPVLFCGNCSHLYNWMQGAPRSSSCSCLFCLLWSPGLISLCPGPAGSVWFVWVHTGEQERILVQWGMNDLATLLIFIAGQRATVYLTPMDPLSCQTCDQPCSKGYFNPAPNVLRNWRTASGLKIYAETATGVQCCREVFEITF